MYVGACDTKALLKVHGKLSHSAKNSTVLSATRATVARSIVLIFLCVVKMRRRAFAAAVASVLAAAVVAAALVILVNRPSRHRELRRSTASLDSRPVCRNRHTGAAGNDTDADCARWAAAGKCVSSDQGVADYMMTHCELACALRGVPVTCAVRPSAVPKADTVALVLDGASANACVPPHQCSAHLDEDTCNSNPSCLWHSGQCVPASDPTCSNGTTYDAVRKACIATDVQETRQKALAQIDALTAQIASDRAQEAVGQLNFETATDDKLEKAVTLAATQSTQLCGDISGYVWGDKTVRGAWMPGTYVGASVQGDALVSSSTPSVCILNGGCTCDEITPKCGKEYNSTEYACALKNGTFCPGSDDAYTTCPNHACQGTVTESDGPLPPGTHCCLPITGPLSLMSNSVSVHQHKHYVQPASVFCGQCQQGYTLSPTGACIKTSAYQKQGAGAKPPGPQGKIGCEKFQSNLQVVARDDDGGANDDDGGANDNDFKTLVVASDVVALKVADSPEQPLRSAAAETASTPLITVTVDAKEIGAFPNAIRLTTGTILIPSDGSSNYSTLLEKVTNLERRCRVRNDPDNHEADIYDCAPYTGDNEIKSETCPEECCYTGDTGSKTSDRCVFSSNNNGQYITSESLCESMGGDWKQNETYKIPYCNYGPPPKGMFAVSDSSLSVNGDKIAGMFIFRGDRLAALRNKVEEEINKLENTRIETCGSVTKTCPATVPTIPLKRRLETSLI